MCGIFGILANNKINNSDFKKLGLFSRERGKDSCGFLTYSNSYKVMRFNEDIKEVINQILPFKANLAIGHSRLITNSTQDNQPILRDDISCIHNGIILNFNNLFKKYKLIPKLKIDTEILPTLVKYFLEKNLSLDKIISIILEECKGIINCAITIPKLGKIILISNNGSLYGGKKNSDFYFASEKFFLEKIHCTDIFKISREIFDVPKNDNQIMIEDNNNVKKNLDYVPVLKTNIIKKNLLKYNVHKLQRCIKCILPSTMPFIKFDENGICNYCKNYKKKNFIKYNLTEADDIFNKFRHDNQQADCIVPLSGGRDSCLALHLAKKKFNLNPIAYTYDWGLVTDLARRNISRMCSQLSVENIIFADNISKKRIFIKKNVLAWLKKPHLGMVNIFTAGDKHFYRHVQTVKKRTRLKLDLWGINPYERTHFKSGFLGISPDFSQKENYSTGLMKQVHYHGKRFFEMLKNPSYLNTSIFDNLYGEAYRSIVKKNNHYSIFDFHKWNENEVDNILNLYDWEKSIDTKSTWRIGDGAAAFYNYIYYTLAGFSEHDTFRSNQIREGEISREDALELVKQENQPRYENIKWFLDILSLDFESVINRINIYKLI